MNNFLSINEITFPYPFDLASGLILFIFLMLISKVIANKFIIINDKYLNFISSYIIIISFFSIIIFFLSLIKFDYLFLRNFFWFLIITTLLVYHIELKKIFGFCIKFAKNNFLISLLIFSFLILSFLPSIDADTIDYHLGIGLDVIREGKLNNRLDWLHFRLGGSGEYLNLFGLVIGSKNFGQIIQFSSLIILLLSLISISKTNKFKNKEIDKLINLCVFSAPILIVLIYSQKYQIFGSSIIFFLLVLISRYLKFPSKKTLLILTLSLSFLVTLKHSFIISGALITSILILIAYKKKQIYYFLFSGLIFFLIFSFPYFFKNYLFYGDPISPLLEIYKVNYNQDIVNFAESIKIADKKLNLNNFGIFILNFLIPVSFSSILNFIGIPALLVLLSFNFYNYNFRYLLFFIIFYLIIFLILGQNSIRYYLDFIFSIILIIKLNLNLIKSSKILNIILKFNYLQSFIVVLLNFIILAIYIPKGFDQLSYEKILKKYAYNYNEIIWIQENTSQNSIIISENIRSNALQTRKFITQDILKYYNNLDS